MKKIAAKVGKVTIENINDSVGSVSRIVEFLGEVAISIKNSILNPRKIRWKEVSEKFDMCGPKGVPITIVICLLMGIILGINGVIQLSKYGADIFIADMIAIMSIKELGALLVAVIATGRAGSAFAAEIGTMKVNEEVDALITMGLDPLRFLVIPKLIAMIIAMPILVIFGNIAAIAGGMIVGVFNLGIPWTVYLDRTMQVVKISYFFEGISKVLIYGFLITIIGCLQGFNARNDAQSVGNAATSAVVNSIFAIAIANAILTLLFNLLS